MQDQNSQFQGSKLKVPIAEDPNPTVPIARSQSQESEFKYPITRFQSQGSDLKISLTKTNSIFQSQGPNLKIPLSRGSQLEGCKSRGELSRYESDAASHDTVIPGTCQSIRPESLAWIKTSSHYLAARNTCESGQDEGSKKAPSYCTHQILSWQRSDFLIEKVWTTSRLQRQLACWRSDSDHGQRVAHQSHQAVSQPQQWSSSKTAKLDRHNPRDWCISAVKIFYRLSWKHGQ